MAQASSDKEVQVLIDIKNESILDFGQVAR